ncbi:hypothetical protein MMC14_004010 [Varicellaria rhodocarpa]|nr:hypothetical protein [Varicellaria rhodocarpa]
MACLLPPRPTPESEFPQAVPFSDRPEVKPIERGNCAVCKQVAVNRGSEFEKIYLPPSTQPLCSQCQEGHISKRTLKLRGKWLWRALVVISAAIIAGGVLAWVSLSTRKSSGSSQSDASSTTPVTEPSTKITTTASSFSITMTSSTSIALPTALSNVTIVLPSLPPQPPNTTTVEIAFTFQYSWGVVFQNQLSAAQIFELLPVAIAFALGIAVESVIVQELDAGVNDNNSPMLIRRVTTHIGATSVVTQFLPAGSASATANPTDSTSATNTLYMPTIAIVWFPTHLVKQLAQSVFNTSSAMYNNPVPNVRNLTSSINITACNFMA